jgi:hypothetical protein
MNNQGHEIDFGVGTLSGDKPKYGEYLENLAHNRGSTGSGSTRHADIHSSGAAAIRDYGAAMGLPPDSSSWGH